MEHVPFKFSLKMVNPEYHGFQIGNSVTANTGYDNSLLRSNNTGNHTGNEGPVALNISDLLGWLFGTCGYVMFFAWSISFYPQLFKNFRRKSTEGMSIAFQWYNLLGFGLYFAYNVMQTKSTTMQDRLFSLHAFILTLFTLIQVPLYVKARDSGPVSSGNVMDRGASSFSWTRTAGRSELTSPTESSLPQDGTQSIIPGGQAGCLPQMPHHSGSAQSIPQGSSSRAQSLHQHCGTQHLGGVTRVKLPRKKKRFHSLVIFPLIHKITLVIMVVAITAIALFNRFGKIFVYSCGFVKTVISILKYTPQVYMNYQRKSTEGYAMANTYLDLTGGAFNILQQVVMCIYDQDTGLVRDSWTWAPFTNNLPKFFIGCASLVYDTIYLVQHFLLYPQPGHLQRSRAEGESDFRDRNTSLKESSEILL